MELLVLCYRGTRARTIRKKKPRYSRPVAFQYVNRVAEESFQDGPGSSVDVESERSSLGSHMRKT